MTTNYSKTRKGLKLRKNQPVWMTPQALADWMMAHGFHKFAAAEALGLSRTSIDRYLIGKSYIPKVVALACSGFDFVEILPAEHRSKVASYYRVRRGFQSAKGAA